MPAPFVLFLKLYPWHGPMLERVFPLLPPTVLHTCVEADAIKAGWRPQHKPALVVVADAGAIRGLRPVFPDSLFMHVGHGLISKNETGYHYREADYICVASDAVAARLTQRGHIPRREFLPIGLIQMDPLFRPMEEIQTLRVAGTSRSIIYAPTWNPSLSSADMFGAGLVKWLRGEDEQIGILIKPHPHTPMANPEWVSAWAQMAEEHPNVQLANPASDLPSALIGADLMVSDASSAIFQFLALDRPIVLVDNPARHGTPRCFDPDGIEWQWRDIGARVQDVRVVAEAVREGLNRPFTQSQRAQQAARQERRRALFGTMTDGRAAERVASAIESIVSKVPAVRGPAS